MDSILDYLEKKKLSLQDNNELYYAEFFFINRNLANEHTFKDLLEDVERRIKYIMEKYKISNKKFCFLIVNNSYQDIVSFLALLKLGIKPVIINEKNLFDYYMDNYMRNDGKSLDIDIDVILPFSKDSEELIQDDCIEINITRDIYDEDGHYHEVKMYKPDENRIKQIILTYLYNNPNVYHDLINNDYDFALPTSGTTGESVVVTIKEKNLINKLQKHYDLNKPQTYVGFTPISSISGLIFSVYLPIMGEDIKICLGYEPALEDANQYDHLTVLLPGNYQVPEYLTNNFENNQLLNGIYRYDSLLNKAEKVILLGDKAQASCIEQLHQKNKKLKYGTICNSFGRTENLGIISTINEKNMKTVYVYYRHIEENKLIYTFDKKTVYETEKIGKRLYHIKSNIIYNEEDFCEVEPIALASEYKEELQVHGAFNELIAEGKKTGDYAFILDDRVYILCRKNELMFENNYYSYISPIESIICKKMNEKKLVSRYKQITIKQFCYCVVNDNNHINIYIPCRINYASENNYRRYRDFYKDFKSLIPKDIVVDKILLFDRANLPIGHEIGKLKRKRILELATINEADLNNEKFDFQEIIAKKLNNRKFDYQDNYFVFHKSDTTIRDILDITKQIKIMDFLEDNDNYYVIFSDDFLFAKRNEERDYIKKYIDMYFSQYNENNKISLRKFILIGYNILKTKICILRFFYDEENRLSVIMDFPCKTKHNVKTITMYEAELQTSSFYENIYGDQYYDIVYSIDDDENLYLNGKLIDLAKYQGTIINDMKHFLLKEKSNTIVKRLGKVYK